MKTGLLSMCLIAVTACSAVADSPEPAATSSATSELGNSCTVACNDARLRCEATCERFPRPSCEENCDQRFSNCMHVCGCPFNEEFDRVSFDHADATQLFLCVGPIGKQGVSYQRYDLFDRVDHVRDTLQCDGTTTETVVSSTVISAGPCFHRLVPDFVCGPTDVTTPPLCTL